MRKSSSGHDPKVPSILPHAGPLLARYDVIFCDVWGVVHNGATAFEGACRALEKFRAGGGTVILVTNAPVPKQRVADMLMGFNFAIKLLSVRISDNMPHRPRQFYRVGRQIKPS